MKTLKKEIKELGLKIRTLKNNIKNISRNGGIAGWEIHNDLKHAKEEYRTKFLAYCYLKENNGNIKDFELEKLIKKHETKSKEGYFKDIHGPWLFSFIEKFSKEIEERRNFWKEDLKTKAKKITETRLKFKSQNKLNQNPDYAILIGLKDEYRSCHIAYSLLKKQLFRNSITIDKLTGKINIEESLKYDIFNRFHIEKENNDLDLPKIKHYIFLMIGEEL